MKKLANIATSNATGERRNRRHTGLRTLSELDEISLRAFSLYESRGRQDGFDIEDWLRAEQELVQHYAQRRRIHNHTRRTANGVDQAKG